MTCKIPSRRTGDRAFTLIELVIVIVIAGILGAALVTVYVDQSEAQSAGKAKVSPTQSKNLTGVLEAGLASYQIESNPPSGSTEGNSKTLAKANRTNLSGFEGVYAGTVTVTDEDSNDPAPSGEGQVRFQIRSGGLSAKMRVIQKFPLSDESQLNVRQTYNFRKNGRVRINSANPLIDGDPVAGARYTANRRTIRIKQVVPQVNFSAKTKIRVTGRGKQKRLRLVQKIVDRESPVKFTTIFRGARPAD